MAKEVKPKKAAVKKVIEPIIETPTAEVTHSGITEVVPISDEGIIEVTPVTEVEIVPEPIIVEEEKAVEVIAPEPKPIIQKEDTYAYAADEELSMEQKIINFMEDKSGEVRLNDFLKSLFGLPKPYEPAQWLNQGANRLLRATLEKLSKDGLLAIKDNAHMRLGNFYYPDSTTGKTEYHNLNTVKVFATK